MGLCFRSEFPYDYGSSVLSSPVESVVGSTETESDEDDLLLTELTRQLALHEAHKITPAQKKSREGFGTVRLTSISADPENNKDEEKAWAEE